MDAEKDLWQETHRGVIIAGTVKQAKANLTKDTSCKFTRSCGLSFPPCGEGESITENQSTGLDVTDWGASSKSGESPTLLFHDKFMITPTAFMKKWGTI